MEEFSKYFICPAYHDSRGGKAASKRCLVSWTSLPLKPLRDTGPWRKVRQNRDGKARWLVGFGGSFPASHGQIHAAATVARSKCIIRCSTFP
jgi:hypothetical protein